MGRKPKPRAGPPIFRLVRDLTTKPGSNPWAMKAMPYGIRDPRSDEADGLDWNGLAKPGTYWGDILLLAKRDNLVTIPNVDACTAWCAAKAGLRVASMKDHRTQIRATVGPPAVVPSDALWAFFTPIDFAKKYMVPYFDLLEKKEIPDMSLLEWLVTMGGIAPSVARAAVTRYSHPRKGDPILLHETDRLRLGAAADARAEAIAAEASAPSTVSGARGSFSA